MERQVVVENSRNRTVIGLAIGLLSIGVLVLGIAIGRANIGKGAGDSLLKGGPEAAEPLRLVTRSSDDTPAGSMSTLDISRDVDDSRDNAIVRASRIAGPSVVSVSVIQTLVARGGPFFGQSGDDFFEQFFGDVFPPRVYRERIPSLGSGFVISDNGYVLTNEHVVHSAEQIKVTLPDGRQFDGKLVGSDSSFDLAVLKIDAKGLPVAVLGNSDDIVVGEWAIAIGNPFGFLLNDPSPSVTAGVISALKRDVKSTGLQGGIYKDMIQTDAAINPGNSGGPLVNGKGQVIGVNTFIFTQSGGSLGMGFAIPVNIAKRVVEEIIKFGAVRGVWVGISVQDITPYVASHLGITDTHGVIVARLEQGSPADKAGVKAGDIIRKVQGQQVNNSTDAQRSIFGAGVGDVVVLTIERDDKRWDVKLKLEEVPKKS
ncbi:MAG: trypsin-like peptidase domain-containing protein [Candidatus Eisenbacteria bacterium]|nr:trypsin-like peptidase domain-containing protein [Candidatus Eisenbacteria bacterium]